VNDVCLQRKNSMHEMDCEEIPLNRSRNSFRRSDINDLIKSENDVEENRDDIIELEMEIDEKLD
jgi:hypothetical protein